MPWLERLGGDPALLTWVAVAALVEAAMYASMARESWRRRWQRRMLVVAAPLSCALYHVALPVSSLKSVLGLGAMAAVFVGLSPSLSRRRHGWIWVSALAAAPILLKTFRLLYPPAGELRMEFLGQLMWIRTTVITVLRDLELEGVHFGFWPRAREWKTGFLYFVLLMPVALGLAWATGFAQPALPEGPWTWTAARAAAAFFGILWVVALSEEFFFRGLLYGAVRRRMHPVFAIPLSGGFFAALHPQGGTGLVAVFLLGCALAGLYEWRRSLWPGIVLHALNNGVILWATLALFAGLG